MFDTHKLNPAGTNAVINVKALAKDFLDGVLFHLPAGRENALFKTNLEQAVMWAVKGICALPYNQTGNNHG